MAIAAPPPLKDRLHLSTVPEEARASFQTLSGMILLLMGRLATTGDTVEWDGWRFEVVDLDNRRIDKVLASRLPETEPETG